MKFRPCIDIHNGMVKQIIGSSLNDETNSAEDNFVSEKNADYYAELYKENNLPGGHIILLNPAQSEYYQADCKQAYSALAAFPGGMQIGGGVIAENAADFINKGASHVIVTSYVFKNGTIEWKNLDKLVSAVGKSHIVLDLSCRRRGEDYYIVTDRWQKYTDIKISNETLNLLAGYCDEFLVHAVDVEGKSAGIDIELAGILGGWQGIPITYAGGISSFADLDILNRVGNSKLDATIGSSLDLFGGSLNFEKVLEFFSKTSK